jgi:hypothetical protein
VLLGKEVLNTSRQAEQTDPVWVMMIIAIIAQAILYIFMTILSIFHTFCIMMLAF